MNCRVLWSDTSHNVDATYATVTFVCTAGTTHVVVCLVFFVARGLTTGAIGPLAKRCSRSWLNCLSVAASLPLYSFQAIALSLTFSSLRKSRLAFRASGLSMFMCKPSVTKSPAPVYPERGSEPQPRQYIRGRSSRLPDAAVTRLSALRRKIFRSSCQRQARRRLSVPHQGCTCPRVRPRLYARRRLLCRLKAE